MVRAGVPVHSKGGWVQINLRPAPAPGLELGGRAGIDDPDDEDLDGFSRLRNRAVEAHVAWRHAPVVVGLEVRRLQTDYAPPAGTRSATHVNLAAGFEF